jgi:hypothetical protein
MVCDTCWARRSTCSNRQTVRPDKTDELDPNKSEGESSSDGQWRDRISGLFKIVGMENFGAVETSGLSKLLSVEVRNWLFCSLFNWTLRSQLLLTDSLTGRGSFSIPPAEQTGGGREEILASFFQRSLSDTLPANCTTIQDVRMCEWLFSWLFIPFSLSPVITD